MATSRDAALRAGPGAGLPLDIGGTRTSTGDQAALCIRRLIFDGVLRPGSRVPQAEVAKTLGISRIPVREALIGLEREGWVRIELHRGAFINAFNEATVRDHYELYGLVYGFAAQRAIDRGQHLVLGEQLSRIAKSIVRVKDPGRFAKLAIAFHQTVLEASSSRPATTLTQALSSMVPGDFFSLAPAAMPIETHSLPIIASAVVAGHREQVAEEYRSMMRAVGEVVCGVFADRGLFVEEPHAAQARRRRTRTVAG